MVTIVLPLGDGEDPGSRYLDHEGRSPYTAWLELVDAPAAGKVAAALYQLSVANWSNVKGLGWECTNARWTSVPDTGFISARTR